MEPLISVIIPVYNAQRYISSCLESVMDQSYENIEIILINDGSTDSSGVICEEYAKKDARIHLYSQSNQGVSMARNVGITHAVGEYCYFLDSDDRIKRNTLECTLQSLVTLEADLVSFSYCKIKEDGTVLEEVVFSPHVFEAEQEEQKFQYMFDTFLEYKVGFEIWNKLYRLDIIKLHNLLFDRRVIIGEDIGFNLKYITYCKRIVCLEDIFYQYVVHSDSAMGKNASIYIRLNEFTYFLKELYELWKKDGDKTFLVDHFYLIFSKAMENQYCRGTAQDMGPYIKEIEDKDFYLQQVDQILVHFPELEKEYGKQLAKRRWRENLFYRSYFGRLPFPYSSYLSLYRFYRWGKKQIKRSKGGR